jgi:hypothetical protein
LHLSTFNEGKLLGIKKRAEKTSELAEKPEEAEKKPSPSGIVTSMGQHSSRPRYPFSQRGFTLNAGVMNAAPTAERLLQKAELDANGYQIRQSCPG